MTALAICNRALTVIGESPSITALSPPTGSAHAQLCATLYAQAVETVTESRHWTHTDRRTALAKITLSSPTADASTDTITTVSAHALAAGNPVSFEVIGSGPSALLPEPLEEGVTYYVRAVSGLGFTITDEAFTNASETTAIDLTTAGGGWACYKESDRDGWAYMYALPTDCLTERNLVPTGAPDDWRSAAAGRPYTGAVGSSWNGLNYSADTFGYGPTQPFPWKRAVNSGGEAVIYTNLGDPHLVYSCFVTDTTQWPPMFKEAVTFELAARLGGAIKKDVSIVDWCQGRSQGYINEAARIDGQRGVEGHSQPYPWGGHR